MDLFAATERYEAWLGGQLALVAADLRAKHAQMAEGPFPFLRATGYRWAQRWPEVCPDLDAAPEVLAVGDLHLANFGTWRDAEGRLAWGVNDLDEATRLPYTADLVRLAASVLLAREAGAVLCDGEAACDPCSPPTRRAWPPAGGRSCSRRSTPRCGPWPSTERRDPARFWAKLDGLTPAGGALPAAAVAALEALLPAPGLPYRVAHREAGLGSLGRQRFVAVADWCGGRVAREAKALAPSSWDWARPAPRRSTDPTAAPGRAYAALLERAVRCPDPWVAVRGPWLVRRLAPDCTRIELDELGKKRDEAELLRAMGWETANVHLGTPEALPRVQDDLRRRPAGWLTAAAAAMADAVTEEWRAWRARPAGRRRRARGGRAPRRLTR